MMVPRTMGMLLPPQIRMKMPYVESGIGSTINAGGSPAGVSLAYQWSGNRLRDPQLSVAPNTEGFVAHQPRGFDQIATLYEKYYVVGSTFNIKMKNTEVAASGGTMFLTPSEFLLPINPSSALYDNLERSMTMTPERSKVKHFGGRTTGFSQWVFMGGRQNTNRMLPQSDFDDKVGDIATGPLDQWVWNLLVRWTDKSAGTQVREIIEITIVYDVIWFLPVNLTGSSL